MFRILKKKTKTIQLEKKFKKEMYFHYRNFFFFLLHHYISKSTNNFEKKFTYLDRFQRVELVYKISKNLYVN